MPGVTFKNYKLIMNSVENLRALSQLNENELTNIMGQFENKHHYSIILFTNKRYELVLDIKSKQSRTIVLHGENDDREH